MFRKIVAAVTILSCIMTMSQLMMVSSDDTNLAFNGGSGQYPRVFASYTFWHDNVNHLTDGIVSYSDSPRNRWSSYESPDPVVYIGSDFGTEKQVSRVELCVFNDGGGVVPPASIEVQYLNGGSWTAVSGASAVPAVPVGQLNVISFNTVSTVSVRVKLTAQPGRAVGMTEMRIYRGVPVSNAYSITLPETVTSDNPEAAITISFQQASASDRTVYIKATGVNGGIYEQSYIIPANTLTYASVLNLGGINAGTINIISSLSVDYSDSQSYTIVKLPDSGDPPGDTENLAYNDGSQQYPAVFATYTYFRDSVSHLTDGIISYSDNPRNRWTSYESSDSVVYIGSDFGSSKQAGSVELFVYNDGGGVVPPESIEVQYLNNGSWTAVSNQLNIPAVPAGELNTINFNTVTTNSIRLKLTAKAGKGAGATEMRIYGTQQGQNDYSLTLPGTFSADNPVIPVTIHLHQAFPADKTVFIKAEDSSSRIVESSYIVPANIFTYNATMDLSYLLAGSIRITASLSQDYSDARIYTIVKTAQAGDGIINQIYEEVKSPYRYGVVLKWSGVSGDFDSQMVDNPNVFKIPGDNDHVYMTYVGFNGTGYQTGLARSRDFLNWEKLGVILDSSTASDWDRYNAAGYIVRDHTWGKAPVPHITADGKLAMTYLASDTAGYEAGIKKAGVAFANGIFNQDGSLQQWQRHPYPVLDASTGEYPYEGHTIWKLQAIWDADNNRYVGFYNASGGPEIMCQAYSPNLINWVREPSNPVITHEYDENGYEWGSTHNADADTVKIGNTWVMFYFTDSPDGIIDSFAVSTDMVNWDKSFKSLTVRTGYSGSYAHKPCVLKHNGVVYHYYCGVGDQGRIIAVDTSVDLQSLKIAREIKPSDCSPSDYALLQSKIQLLQSKLVEDNGSKESVLSAVSELQAVLDLIG